LAHNRVSIERIINALGYDFNAFTLPDFIQHLQHQRDRPIVVQGFPLSPTLFGMWIPAPTADYILYNDRLHAIHQIHTILHELAHVLLDHSCYRVDQILSPDLLRELGGTPFTARMRTAEPVGDPEQEAEAELFVDIIQGQLLRVQRLDRLYRGQSSVPLFRPYADGMGFES